MPHRAELNSEENPSSREKSEMSLTRFLVDLGEAGDKTGWQIHAFCLLLKHFHLDAISAASSSAGIRQMHPRPTRTNGNRCRESRSRGPPLSCERQTQAWLLTLAPCQPVWAHA